MPKKTILGTIQTLEELIKKLRVHFYVDIWMKYPLAWSN
jgi:hypothetical protein